MKISDMYVYIMILILSTFRENIFTVIIYRKRRITHDNVVILHEIFDLIDFRDFQIYAKGTISFIFKKI